MIYHAFTKDNGFVCGDSTTGVTCYAFPNSIHAIAAKKNPVKVSLEMIADELGSLHDSNMGREYDLYNWTMLHDAESDHTVRAIIDTVMERLIPAQQKEAK